MSKLDQILSFASEIESRSTRLADATSTSIDLINHISYINQQLLNHDHDLDEIRQLMNNNQSCLIQLNALSERIFYLQSNLPINDYITNQTSFEHLNTEYNHILSKLAVNTEITDEFEEEEEDPQGDEVEHHFQHLDIEDSYFDDLSDEEEEEEEEQEGAYLNDFQSTSPTLEPPDLRKMISISNLQLKPMRCASSSAQAFTNPKTNTTPISAPVQPRSIQKKKSKYRLSSIYNINPVALEDKDCALYSNRTSYVTSAASSSPPSEDSDRMMKNSLSQSFDTIESHFSNHISLSKQDDQHDTTLKNEDDDENTETLPDPSPANASALHKHVRSNSLPTSSSAKSIDQIDLFKDLDYQEDYLRFNRLKHFISISSLPRRSPRFGTAEDELEDDNLFYQEFEKSLTPQQCLDNCDVCSVLSDVSYYSPEKQQHGSHEEDGKDEIQGAGGDARPSLEFDTYSSFLRKSKLNLNEAYHTAFPHLYQQRQSTNIENVTEQDQQQAPAQESHHVIASHNFKNPIATIGSTTPHTVSPTLDTSFEREQHPVLSASQSTDKLSSRKLLTQVISQSPFTVKRDAFASGAPSTPKLHQSYSPSSSSPPLPISKRNAHSVSSSPLSSRKIGTVVAKSSPSIAASPSSPTSSSTSPSFTHNLINFMSMSKMHRHKQQQEMQDQQYHQRQFHMQYLANPFTPQPLHVSTKPPTPEKIRQLKKQKRLKRHVPISIPNEAQLKRVPPQSDGRGGGATAAATQNNSFKNDASFAKLTILRNQKYINTRGDSLSFSNSPIVRECNHDALREALSASLLE
ncbi:hypothetical protein I9W82_005146 [Candida metapsilosis]|uniref:Uncharacterized protein n=1 Tax=Candida metapsilosis TaxID=273372 RepID=A0A8H7ZDN0_9ASCO|nr:hypothetical protein I9W82_005146 [Candida metapsilosis]